MRPHDWAGFAAIAALILAVVALIGGHFGWAAGWTAVMIGAAVASRSWSLRHRGPMPHLMWWILLLPRGNHSPAHLQRVLEPRRGMRLLEIGPGIGVHSLPIASALLPGGTLEVLDVQQAMLDDLARRAERAGITNIVATRADARVLPYPDQGFDGAYLIGVLGEIPDGHATLRELHRVLKPGGRLVVGEALYDPDYVSPSTLKEMAGQAGFVFDRIVGPAMSYLAVFHRPKI
jgi:SAM-dependent methyltransferase